MSKWHKLMQSVQRLHWFNSSIGTPGPEVIKLCFILNSTKHEIDPADKFWQFYIYQQNK